MANKFVWSGATGANDGSSWGDAYTTLMKDWGAEGTFTPATDIIYVRSVHSETLGATTTITGSTAEGTTAPCRIYCVVGDTTGTTPGNLATGATVATNVANADINIYESIYIYGVIFNSIDFIYLGANNSTDHNIVLEQCALNLVTNGGNGIGWGGTGSGGQSVRLIDTDIDLQDVSDFFEWGDGSFVWDGGTFVSGVTANEVWNSASGARSANWVVRNVDFSAQSGDELVDLTTPNVHQTWRFERCLLNATPAKTTGSIDVPGSICTFIHCQSGTDADPAYQMEQHTMEGTVSAATASYRTGGASDGERTNPISWDMDTTTGSVRQYPGHPLESPPIVGWTDGDASTAHVYRIYFASGGTQTDATIWFDLTGPNDAATNSLGVRKTTRVAPETSASNHTTDGTSTWTGSDVGTKQYMEITYTPDKPGPISAVVKMVSDAGSTGHIFVDPVVVIDP